MASREYNGKAFVSIVLAIFLGPPALYFFGCQWPVERECAEEQALRIFAASGKVAGYAAGDYAGPRYVGGDSGHTFQWRPQRPGLFPIEVTVSASPCDRKSPSLWRDRRPDHGYERLPIAR